MNENYDNQDFSNQEDKQTYEYKPDFILKDSDQKNYYQEAYRNNDRREKRGPGVFGFIALALIFSLLGGVIGAYGILKYTNTTFNDLSSKYSEYLNYNPPTFGEEEGGLTVTEIVKRVGPAVVGVSTKNSISYGYGQSIQEGIGTGFIIDEKGYILTNYHVIQDANSLKVILFNGEEAKAKVVNFDPNQDLAVIKITDDIKMPGIVELGDSNSLQVGEEVVAIGNPLGKEFLGTVTTGVISAISREIAIEGRSIKYLQTDAAINPGNSGGPLLNSRGQVIGINTAKIKMEGVEGISFSIPINDAKSRLPALSKPQLTIGIVARDITPDIARDGNLPEGEYVYIVEISPGSPAEKAGLKPGDRIIGFDGKKIKTVEEINRLKEGHDVGDVVNMLLIRDNGEMTIPITLEEAKD